LSLFFQEFAHLLKEIGTDQVVGDTRVRVHDRDRLVAGLLDDLTLLDG